MIDLILHREPSTDEGTFGRLQGAGLDLISLELPWEGNEPQFSCIPAGVYTAAPFDSPTKGRVYLLQEVPGRSFIEIHSANFGGNTRRGWQSQLLGCIALGLEKARLENIYDRLQWAVLNSRSALSQFLSATRGEPIRLTIVEGEVK